MPITEALKKLIKTITGKNAVGETIEELVTNLNDNYPEGGGDDTYEKIIGTIGSSEKDGDLYFGNFVIEGAPDIKVDSEVKLNGYTLVPVPDAGKKPTFYCNLDLETFVPVATPAYILDLDFGSGETKTTVTVGCDTDIGGETVALEYKNSSGGSNDYIIEGDLIIDGPLPRAGEIQINVSELDAAIAANKNVKLVLSCSTPIDATFVLPFVESASNSGYFFMGACDYSFVTYIARMYIDRTDTTNQSFVMESMPAALHGVKPTYEFGFTVTPGQTESELIITPDAGSTYAAITAALAETPNVYAVLDLGFQNQVIRALFSIDSTVSGEESTSANAMIWGGTKWIGARLMVSASGTDVLINDL